MDIADQKSSGPAPLRLLVSYVHTLSWSVSDSQALKLSLKPLIQSLGYASWLDNDQHSQPDLWGNNDRPSGIKPLNLKYL